MTKNSTLFALLITIPTVAACGDKKTETAAKADEPSSASGKGEAIAPPPSSGDAAATFASWDMTARRAAWNGAWAGEGQALGHKAAWSITESGEITYVDSQGEKKLALELESPCSAKFVEKTANGSSSWTKKYTLKDGNLITGLGDAGQRKGDQAIVCGGASIFAFDGKTCTVWKSSFGKLEAKPGECGFKTDDKGAEVFWYKSNDRESTVLVDGDVIWSEQLANRHAEKHADLAAAKAAQEL